MGLQWCPRDPKIKVNDQVIDLYALIPNEFADDFDKMWFVVFVPIGAEYEVLYTEDGVEIDFIEERRQKLRRRDEFLVDVDVKVSGVPDDTILQLLMFAPFDGTLQTKTGNVGGVRNSILLDRVT